MYSHGQQDVGYARPMDMSVSFPVVMLFLAVWALLCLAGLAVIIWTDLVVLGIVIVVVPTFVGMVAKPTFALCVMMLILPTGAGVGAGDVFSLDRGAGILVGLACVFNAMLTRPGIRGNKALLVLVLYSVWIASCTALFSPYVETEITYVFTQFQLLVLILIVYWVIQANGEGTLLWMLRSFVMGTLIVTSITVITGAAMVSQEMGAGRYSATLGQGAVDANMLAGILALAFISSVYLLARDRQIGLRIVYLVAILGLPLMTIMTGSRGVLIALVFTILSPVIFMRQIVRRPVLLVVILLVVVLSTVVVVYVVSSSGYGQLTSRLTDVGQAERSVSYRMELNVNAAFAMLSNPEGLTRAGWLSRYEHVPHNDLCYALGVYGLPGGGLFVLFIWIVALMVKRMPLGAEKIYLRAVLTLLIVIGLGLTQLFMKHYWIFMAIMMASDCLVRREDNVDPYGYLNE
jgi:hypothetical protein